jgi:hypothetical protein
MRIEDGLIVNSLYLSSGATYITSADSKFNVVSATDYFDTTFFGYRVLVSSPTKQIMESAITTTHLGYLTDVTSNIQAQINTKQNIITNPITGTGTVNRLSKFSSTSGLSNSNISDDGTTISLLSRLSTVNIVQLKPELFKSLDSNYIGDSSSLLSKPYDYQTHDWSAYTSPMYEVYNGTAWTSATLNPKLFDGFPSSPVYVVTSATSTYGSRWTWNNTGWSDINTVIITTNYTGNTSPTTFTIETAVSGTTDWTTINTWNGNGIGAQTLYMNVPGIAGNSYFRFVVEVPNGYPLSLTSIQLISGRIGDQGKSKYNYLPFSWDYNKLVTFNNTIANTVTAQKFIDSNYVGDRVLVSKPDKSLDESSISTTTLLYLSGVSSDIQSQLNSKANTSHNHNYLPLSGGTMTGALNFANNTWNTVGDDFQFGDINAASVIGFRGSNSTIGYIRFGNSTSAAAETVASDFGWNGTEFRIGSNKVWHLGNLVGDQTTHYHNADRMWGNITGKPTTLAGYGISPSDPYLSNISGYIKLQTDYSNPQVGYGVLSAGGGYVITSGATNQTTLGYNSLVMLHGTPRVTIAAGDSSIAPSINLSSKSGAQGALVLRGSDDDCLSYSPGGAYNLINLGNSNSAGFIRLGDNLGRSVFGVGYDTLTSSYMTLYNGGMQIFDISYSAGRPRINFGTGGASSTQFVTSTTEENFITSDLRIIQGGLRIYGQMVITSAANAFFQEATLNNLGPNLVVISDSSKKLISSNITISQLNNLSATTSDIQAQLNAKADKSVVINVGVGISGGGNLSASRTLSLATTGTAGTYTKVVTDAYGRVTSGGQVQFSDVVGLSTNYLPLSGGTMSRAGGAIVNWNNGMRQNIYSDVGSTLKAIYTTSGNTYYSSVAGNRITTFDTAGLFISGANIAAQISEDRINIGGLLGSGQNFNVTVSNNDVSSIIGYNSKITSYAGIDSTSIELIRESIGGILINATGQNTYIDLTSNSVSSTNIRIDSHSSGNSIALNDGVNSSTGIWKHDSYYGMALKLNGSNNHNATLGSGLGTKGGSLGLFTSGAVNIQISTDTSAGAELAMFHESGYKTIDLFSGSGSGSGITSPSLDMFIANGTKTVAISADLNSQNGYLGLGRNDGNIQAELYSTNSGGILTLGYNAYKLLNLVADINGARATFKTGNENKYFDVVPSYGTTGHIMRFYHNDGTTVSTRLNSNSHGDNGGLFFYDDSNAPVFKIEVNQLRSSMSLYSNPGVITTMFSGDPVVDSYFNNHLNFQNGAQIRFNGQTVITSAAAAILTSATINSLSNDRIVTTDSNRMLISSSVTTTQLNNLSGSTSNIQTQLNAKANNSITITGTSGLTGGGNLTANRTLSLATTGTAGTHTKVITDAYGRVTSGGQVQVSDIVGLISMMSSNYLPLSGGNMSGTIRMGSNPVTSASILSASRCYIFDPYAGITHFDSFGSSGIGGLIAPGVWGAADGPFIYGYGGVSLGYTHQTSAGGLIAALRTQGTTVYVAGAIFEGGISLVSKYAPITHNHTWSQITATPTTLTGYGITSTDTMFDAKYININQQAVANGVATLDATIKLPVAQLPDIIDCGTF